MPPPAPRGTALDARPRPAFSLPSKRRVPVLISANKIPVLRLTKPQPASLSHYIKSRIVDRQKRQDRKASLEDQLQLARWEDDWDDILSQKGVRQPKSKQEGTWSREVFLLLKETLKKIEEEGRKNREMAERMVKIVDREKELAEIERKARRREKNEERRRRKAERDGVDVSNGEKD